MGCFNSKKADTSTIKIKDPNTFLKRNHSKNKESQKSSQNYFVECSNKHKVNHGNTSQIHNSKTKKEEEIKKLPDNKPLVNTGSSTRRNDAEREIELKNKQINKKDLNSKEKEEQKSNSKNVQPTVPKCMSTEAPSKNIKPLNPDLPKKLLDVILCGNKDNGPGLLAKIQEIELDNISSLSILKGQYFSIFELKKLLSAINPETMKYFMLDYHSSFTKILRHCKQVFTNVKDVVHLNNLKITLSDFEAILEYCKNAKTIVFENCELIKNPCNKHKLPLSQSSDTQKLVFSNCFGNDHEALEEAFGIIKKIVLRTKIDIDFYVSEQTYENDQEDIKDLEEIIKRENQLRKSKFIMQFKDSEIRTEEDGTIKSFYGANSIKHGYCEEKINSNTIEAIYVNGKYHGYVRTLDQAGKVISQYYYCQGKAHGLAINDDTISLFCQGAHTCTFGEEESKKILSGDQFWKNSMNSSEQYSLQFLPQSLDSKNPPEEFMTLKKEAERIKALSPQNSASKWVFSFPKFTLDSFKQNITPILSSSNPPKTSSPSPSPNPTLFQNQKSTIEDLFSSCRLDQGSLNVKEPAQRLPPFIIE
ncbi:unnamed protein product [Moneuplotes crassus]|uniref:Uncharacterized protein n=1 Tax=Euplotes crassus TaxID=5936 RepID=A0AAD1U9C8_EUPCR|nr:unnamed protein product [Moneuplotes crassus]